MSNYMLTCTRPELLEQALTDKHMIRLASQELLASEALSFIASNPKVSDPADWTSCLEMCPAWLGEENSWP